MRILYVLLCLMIIVVCSIIFTKNDIDLNTIQVEIGDVKEEVLASGFMNPIDFVNVGAQVSGQITRLAVKLGDRVKKGDLLAEIDPLMAENKLKTAESELVSYRAQVAMKKAQLDKNLRILSRKKRLFYNGLGNKAEYEDAKSDVSITESEFNAFQANLDNLQIKVERARAELKYTKIVAPIDGVVISTSAKEGQTLASSQVVPTILTLADINTMTISSQVSEADITKVSIGMPVSFSIVGQPDRTYKSTINNIDLSPPENGGKELSPFEKKAVYYNVLFNVDNKEHVFKVGMSVKATISISERRNVKIIPPAILINTDEHNQFDVEILKDGRVEKRRVKVGVRDSYSAEVIDGLNGDEQLVIK